MQNRLDAEQEKRLVERATKELEAFQELYNFYLPKVYAYMAYRVGRTQDIEDLVAETFLRVVDNFNTFQWQGEGSFAAWLFRIAHNQASNFHRQNNKNISPLPLELLPELKSDVLLPEDTVLQKEKFACLQKLIGTLSERRQEIITLRFFGGLRNNEIAHILELDERTVASHLCRGLDDLHRLYVNQPFQSKKEGTYE